ncbi:DeoR/GlpR family DNA-binding transcription regulator [Alteribacillus sp. YIM 98480]|uniref:DeoR/GlpR family DNA-binding transcription regulator n=1 Tax=Alteribacillus sp. YIM 98480 TaxID=2606599 RepID=UPI00131AE401|nr:DeoR/GlpR family DNA-binding transcription regulator [Alteribacillus sp. YIM 98480]
MNKLFVTERRHKIMEMLNQEQRLTVKRLAKVLGVSEVTLRSDLKEMEKEGLLHRTHGGAMLPKDSVSDNNIPFYSRERKNKNEKRLIAQEALPFIHDGQCILLDASSTALELARLLKDTTLRLTIVTSGIYTALELRENSNFTVIILGGVVRQGSSSLEGVLGSNVLDQVYVDTMFTSANGFTINTGLTDFNMHEVELKVEMVKKSSDVIALVDHTKIGKSSISSFAALEDISTLITNKPLDNDLNQSLEQQDIKIIVPEAALS